MKYFQYVLICLLFLFIGSCNVHDIDEPILVPIQFSELSSDSIPPCLNCYSFEFCLRNINDYNSLRIKYAPQGKYERFTANGEQNKFQLSYQALDADDDGKIGVGDLIIYVSGKPLYVTYNGRNYKLNSTPFYIINNEILIFDSTGRLESRIPYQTVFEIDSINGAVTFIIPPPSGNVVSLCASRAIYDEYNGRTCSMEYFDFNKYSIIGKEINGNGCLKGFNKWLYKDSRNKTFIYKYKRIEDKNTRCPAIHVSFRSWIYFDKIPDDFKIIFEELN
ncbi:MAG: hypothetical protein Q8K98_07610 [Bacteroidota bacterium]|nr:hypothetical protein [Bacteroidota bacterium]